jgi:hypothetical protein
MIAIPEEHLSEKLKTLMEEQLAETLALIREEQDDEVDCAALRLITSDYSEPGPELLPWATIIVKKGELTEKDRILKNEAYLMQLTITFAGKHQARQAYRYAAAVGHLLDEYPTLYAACRRAVLQTKEYRIPRLPGDTETSGVKLTIRAVIEGL